MLAFDYGHLRDDYYHPDRVEGTLSAYADQRREKDPLARPGEVDLTAHVDFAALAEAAHGAGVFVSPVATQGDWLRRLGIDARLQSLAAAAPTRADELKGQRDRLVDAQAMGDLFKVMAFTAPGWSAPAGFTGDAV